MPCLVRRSNGIYYNVVTVNGHRVWKSTGCINKSLAYQALKPVKEEPAPVASTVPTLKEFKTKRLQTVSPVKVNIEFRVLRTALNIAINWELIHENPFRKSKQLRMIKTRPVHFTPEEFKTLLATVTEPWYPAVCKCCGLLWRYICVVVMEAWPAICLTNTDGVPLQRSHVRLV